MVLPVRISAKFARPFKLRCIHSLRVVQASWPSMLAFFSIAALGGISVIVSYLLGLYLAGATAIYASLALTPYLRLGAGEGQTRAYLDHRHED